MVIPFSLCPKKMINKTINGLRKRNAIENAPQKAAINSIKAAPKQHSTTNLISNILL